MNRSVCVGLLIAAVLAMTGHQLPGWLVSVIGPASAVGAETPDSAHGVVEMIVRAPNGHPVADSKIEILANSEFFERGSRRPYEL